MDIETEIRKLEERAERVRRLLVFANRAFVIEFAGTPKSGKSTSVEAIRHFLNRNGFRVHVLIEPASVCPIPMKGHLFFNTWCKRPDENYGRRSRLCVKSTTLNLSLSLA